MSQILSSEEIDALMAGLEEGSIDVNGVEEEIPALAEEKKVTDFFFGQKTAIRVGALPGLDLI
ncbi:MAG: hypothetical protein HQL59_13860, partial [Magnetococcales bacterium]|nr:hypothetical protein [Magnetococcales bacterium]